MSLDFDGLDDIPIRGDGIGLIGLSARGAYTSNIGRAKLILVGRGQEGSHGRGVLTLVGRGAEADSYGRGALALSGHGFAGIETPTPNYGIGRMHIGGSGELSTGLFGEAVGYMFLRARGAYGSSYGRGFMTLTARGRQIDNAPTGTILLLMNPGWLIATIGYVRETLQDVMDVTASPLQHLTNVLAERLALTESPLSTIEALNRITEAATFEDRIGIVWRMILEDVVNFEDPATGITEALERMIERLRLHAGVGSSMDVLMLLAETLAVHDTLAVVARENISDVAHFDEVFTSQLTAKNAILEQLVVDAVPENHAEIAMFLDESVDIGATVSASLESFERLVESLNFSITLTIGDETFLAWVVNTESRSAWTYENYPFNSMWTYQDKAYGLAPDGIYTLDGTDDAGTDIRTSMRIGMHAMGSAKEKRMPAMYVGYDSSGPVVVKVITKRANGDKVENWYQLTPSSARGMREGRIPVGRGLKSVYWGFEIVNVEGSSLRLGELRYFPMILDRRIKRRNS